jgi:hypothetical protein
LENPALSATLICGPGANGAHRATRTQPRQEINPQHD